MVVDFPDPNSLPGGLKTGPLSDTTTYLNIWRIAKNLVDSCVTKGEMGWQPTGMDKSSPPHLRPQHLDLDTLLDL